MANREITAVQALGILADRIQKRKEVWRSLRIEDDNVAISELDIVRTQILRAQEYFKALAAQSQLGKRAGR
jgi:hypothetical protein